MSIVLPFQEGFVTSWSDGINPALPHINWSQAAATGQMVGSPKNMRLLKSPIVAPSPVGCEAEWPCRLFRVAIPDDAPFVLQEDGRVKVSTVQVVAEEEDTTTVLGAQKDELLKMAARLDTITPNEQQALLESTGNVIPMGRARSIVRAIAEQNGRYNTSAALQMMWEGRPHVTARVSIGNVVMALTHRDLLQAGDGEMWELYGRLLCRPWCDVMNAQ